LSGGRGRNGYFEVSKTIPSGRRKRVQGKLRRRGLRRFRTKGPASSLEAGVGEKIVEGVKKRKLKGKKTYGASPRSA